jgi:hypothetical protein
VKNIGYKDFILVFSIISVYIKIVMTTDKTTREVLLIKWENQFHRKNC